ncbi:MAG: mRNA splicing protein prp28 [Chaenotheca gracillima]|nr:MAG: mRNA splicing protein prp28 [Chaenotheca gracillima]
MEDTHQEAHAREPGGSTGLFNSDYNQYVELLREVEYPMLKGAVYLDHAGTTLYSKSLIDRFSQSMLKNLLGNPHSGSPSSQRSSRQIDDIRLRVLQFFNADPEDFDVVFVANATAAAKLVVEAFRDGSADVRSPGAGKGFWYGYHKDSHTSLVGIRETACAGHRCFESDQEVEEWLSNNEHTSEERSNDGLGLFSYPAQSNFNGRRLPLDWSSRLRRWRTETTQNVYTLLDAAAFVSTSQLDLGDASTAPDFTAVSFYKIFGFPDLGALIVRKDAGHVLRRRRYFGGGTVDMVVCLKEQWHEKKSQTLHEQLEDGTLPIHNIVALGIALDVHRELFGPMKDIARHTTELSQQLYMDLSELCHGTGEEVCRLYHDPASQGRAKLQGPVIAFNLRSSTGGWVSNAEVEKLATIKGISIRTGGLCNPGGIASSLALAPWEMKKNFSAGQRCGNDDDIMDGKPTGVIRASLGAMSTLSDVTAFVDFIREHFVDHSTTQEMDALQEEKWESECANMDFRVESLTIYPIKSCAGWKVPFKTSWGVRKEGLAWDREWCIVHLGTGTALSQKKYPKMALIRPTIDLANGVLRIRSADSNLAATDFPHSVEVPLSADPNFFRNPVDTQDIRSRASRVCGDTINARVYTSAVVSGVLSEAIGAPCTLARFPPGGAGPSLRHSKLQLQKEGVRASYSANKGRQGEGAQKAILLSNESPILTITRSSLNRLNEAIKTAGGKAARAEVFRANIVLSEDSSLRSGNEHPYLEDTWRHMRIGDQYYEMLGPCRRCQMVCIDQNTAEINQEPFVTLAKTRRKNGRVHFGQHTCHVPAARDSSQTSQNPTISVGDIVQAFTNNSLVC